MERYPVLKYNKRVRRKLTDKKSEFNKTENPFKSKPERKDFTKEVDSKSKGKDGSEGK